jgi:hypothetical protein
LATKVPSPWRTVMSSSCSSCLIASRSLGREIPIDGASSRFGGRRSRSWTRFRRARSPRAAPLPATGRGRSRPRGPADLHGGLRGGRRGVSELGQRVKLLFFITLAVTVRGAMSRADDRLPRPDCRRGGGLAATLRVPLCLTLGSAGTVQAFVMRDVMTDPQPHADGRATGIRKRSIKHEGAGSCRSQHFG